MLRYDFKIIYKKGKKNVVASALSRKDEDVEALHFHGLLKQLRPLNILKRQCA